MPRGQCTANESKAEAELMLITGCKEEGLPETTCHRGTFQTPKRSPVSYPLASYHIIVSGRQ